MAGLVVVDTDLVIDFLRGRGEGADLVAELVASRRLRITAVTALELRLGTDFHQRHSEIMRLTRSRTLPLDLAAGLAAGAVHGHLQSEGRTIGLADAMQAGICIRFGLPLASRNRRQFERVPGLDLIDAPS